MAASGAFPYVFGTAGNHEFSPVNAVPPLALKNSAAQWVYDTLSSAWTQWIGASASGSTVKSTGAYSVQYASSKLRIISLNTNLYYIQNYWLYETTMETDPSGQWAWLVTELDAAEKSGERVWIIGHMPMGLSDAFHAGSNYFDQIVNRYSATIAAMFFGTYPSSLSPSTALFFSYNVHWRSGSHTQSWPTTNLLSTPGHTHMDHFQISYSSYTARSYTNAKVASYIAPSLTPTSGHPTFRVYTVDPVTFGVLDSTTYMADMTNAAFQTTGPVWTPYYSAKAAYGPLVSPPLSDPAAELTAAFWHNVTAALAADPAAFDQYYARKSRGWDVQPCAGACAALEVCGLQAARAQDNCVVPTPGVNFSKRSEQPPHAHRDECGLSVSRSAIASLIVRRDVLEYLEDRLEEEKTKRRSVTA